MNKILVFDLSGKFAHFNDPLTNPKYLKRTFNIIPKTTLLGVLGAVIGLKGYSYDYEKFPEFYELLKDKRVFINPIDFPFNKKIVGYNSLNSFANNDNKNPNIIMNEEILINPRYRIGVEINEEYQLDRNIVDNVKNRKSFYHIYLGKNEFFARIEYIGLYSYKKKTNKEFFVSSIFPEKYLEEEKEDIDNIIIDRMITGLLFDEKNNVFRSKTEKICFIKMKEKISIKDEYLDSFKKLETGENICLL